MNSKKIQHKYNLPMGDFPNLNRFREKLALYDIHKFPKLDPKKIEAMEQVLSRDIPEITRNAKFSGAESGLDDEKVEVVNPFDLKDAPAVAWLIDSAVKMRYDNVFHSLNLSNRKVSGQNAKNFLMESQLGQETLRQIWTLSDVDQDGYLDSDEFAVCMFLIEGVKSKTFESLPDSLPDVLIPPSKRQALSV